MRALGQMRDNPKYLRLAADYLDYHNREDNNMAVGTGIFLVDVIDMTLESPDVVGTVHLVAANPSDAAKKAMEFLHDKVLLTRRSVSRKYILVGPMPQTGKQIIAVSGAEAQAILKSGESQGDNLWLTLLERKLATIRVRQIVRS